MRYGKIISGCIAFAMIASVALPTFANAQNSYTIQETASNAQKLSSYVSNLDYNQFNRYIFDTDNYLKQDKNLQGLYNALSVEEKAHFWNSIKTARLPVTFTPSKTIGPKFAPIVYFIAATCARIIASRIAQATVTFTAHAIQRANERQITTDQVANAITNGRKMMDQFSRARAIWDQNQNIVVVFVGNTKNISTIYKPEFNEIAQKFVNSNWRW
ncbi:hypothetical protein PM3016_1560 [Paenibacillus mucilaginosus 3016]|uniref:Uncharacterized protein n=1 Tax=Paenibacillus mucilaginosus 3016 TaxID=1116391 RepID=H6N9V5_9BACL|nr:DUF4258 domain-containing protein [Paenibacillus mucilaginosus]AFC28483.1 hypothetical protein PM3016_1560 [Paenibacillus mucilaginosus 3016]WFA17279.1 DUF4258 domain-containing protein [Paenibacillus mucilaginosus]